MLDEEEGQLQERFEEVPIENVVVGDYVCFPAASSSRTQTHCVLLKARCSPAERVVGWQIALANAEPVWLPRRATVKRRRLEISGEPTKPRPRHARR